ncbi:hypothetical protein Glove_132g13 [Diversispora epigaea]|uniref:Uncharacterized protein n=1 Tax=Diversispora epigaea TaxID=1348612 RepID=A0A397J281_9GLOM|nr:hypothetical protein Glove_132g13 [Diversispora epigaea]
MPGTGSKDSSLAFESALTLLNEYAKIEVEAKVSNRDFQEDIKQKVVYFREKSKVFNTENPTKNWIKKFNDFQKDYEYLSNSIKQTIDAIDRYLREVTGSLALNSAASKNEPENLFAHTITIPADSGTYSDIKLYLSKRFICEETIIGRRTQIDISFDALSNHLGRKTAAQSIMQLTEEYPLQEISSNSLNNNSSQTPILNNCTFSNVTFNIQKQ